ncbi:baculoviral IAP repeat-containing protein 6 (apollon), partial [Mytilus galloprovincialis]
MNFDMANLVAKRLRTSTMKLTNASQLIPNLLCEVYYNRSVDIHVPLDESLPLILHDRVQYKQQEENVPSTTRKEDVRSFSLMNPRIEQNNLQAYSVDYLISTFTRSHWSSHRQYPRFLAAAGFYYKGNGTEIHCHKCNLKTDVTTWPDGESPVLAHARLAQRCQFVIDNEFTHSLEFQSKYSHMMETTNNFIKHKDIIYNSLKATPKKLSVVEKEAKAATISTTEHNKICSVENKQLNARNDEIKTIHTKNNIKTNESHSSNQQMKAQEETISLNGTTIFEFKQLLKTPDEEAFTNKIASTTDKKTFAKILSEEGRMHTFTSNNWSSIRWYPRFLAVAGFYYRGNGTEVHCFVCNLKTDVSTWSDSTPQLAHARLAKDCQFVIDNGYNLKLTLQSKDSDKMKSSESDNKVNRNVVSSHTNTPALDETLIRELSANKKQETIQPITRGNLDGRENKMYSRGQEMQTHNSPCRPFDIMSDGFIGLTIDNKTENAQPFSTDQQNIDSNDKHATELNNVFPTMDAMNSQITQDGLQSYQREFKYPQFQSVDARYRSFDTWRFAHKQTPRKLSESGYFYTGENDIVRCFCCDLGLAEWDPKDNPWTEHARHNPKCWFLLSEKGEQFIESIQQDWKKIYNPKHAAFDDKESRIATFDGWRTDIEQTPEILADAGFFYTGEEDTVRCHYCDGGLRNWEPKDVPWEEHARWFPFCKFVIKMKGREFIEYIKRKSEEKQRLENSTSTSSSSGLPDDIRDSPVVKQLTTFGIDEDNISYAITEFTKRTGNSNFTVETLTELIFNRNDQHQINSPFA